MFICRQGNGNTKKKTRNMSKDTAHITYAFKSKDDKSARGVDNFSDDPASRRQKTTLSEHPST